MGIGQQPPIPLKKRAWGDLASSLNIAVGCIAILYVLDGSLRAYYFASALFFIIMALDGIDGALARRTRQSPMGAYLDSISDGIGFVLLPCLILYSLHYKHGLPSILYIPNMVLVSTIVLYTSTGFYRLARFAVMPPTNFFRGAPVSLPSIISICLLGMGVGPFIVSSVLLLSIPLLLSRLPFPKVKRALLAPAAAAVLAGLIAFLLMSVNPTTFLRFGRYTLIIPLSIGLLYLLSPILGVMRKKSNMRHRKMD